MSFNILWAEFPGEVSTDKKGERAATRYFLVETDNAANGLQAAGAIPVARFDTYPGDDGLFCQGAKATPYPDEKTLGWWKVECTYSSELEEQKGKEAQDPKDNDQSKPATQRPWTISFSGLQVQVPMYPEDTEGTKVCASNGQPYTPVIMIPSDHLIIQIEGYKDINAVDPILHHQNYHDRVNETAWTFREGTNTKFQPRTLRVTRDDWQSQFDNGFFFWKFSIALECKWDKWDIKVVDQGTYERVSSGAPLRPILIDGIPTKEPVPLNGSGLRLAPGDPLVYNTFKGYYEAEFSQMI